jgi:uncharacterized Zn finger protein
MARDKFGGPPPMAPQMNVDLSKADDVVCERCGNYTFQNVMLMKRMSALISPTGKEAIVPIPTFSCNACGHINKQFLPVIPKGMQEEAAPTQEEEPKKPTLILEK